MGVDWQIALQPLHLCLPEALNSWQSLSSWKFYLINSCCRWRGAGKISYTKQMLDSLSPWESWCIAFNSENPGLSLITFTCQSTFCSSKFCLWWVCGIIWYWIWAWATLQTPLSFRLYLTNVLRNLVMALLHKEIFPSSLPIASSHREHTELASQFSSWIRFALFFLSLVLFLD